jgi:hypothetical protein
MNLDNVLDSASKKVGKAKKSNIPELLPDEQTQENLLSYKLIREEIDSATAKMKGLAEEILAVAVEMKEKYCKENGFVKSIKLEDKNGDNATIVWSDWYSKIDLALKGEIENLVGNYEKYFQTNMNITVKDVSEADLKELIKRVGEKDFSKFFSVERWISPTSKYTEDFHSLPNKEELRGLVVQRTPSIKVK